MLPDERYNNDNDNDDDNDNNDNNDDNELPFSALEHIVVKRAAVAEVTVTGTVITTGISVMIVCSADTSD